MPTKGSSEAAAFDLYMPEAGTATKISKLFPLGFAAAVPQGYVALLIPRSSIGAKYGLELNNTVEVIDSDYRGEWMAALRIKNCQPYSWNQGDRILQCLIVPALSISFELVEELPSTDRGHGGFGSTGK